MEKYTVKVVYKTKTEPTLIAEGTLEEVVNAAIKHFDEAEGVYISRKD